MPSDMQIKSWDQRLNDRTWRSMCRWPECEFFSVIEMSRGIDQDYVHLCSIHSDAARELSYREWETMDWQPKRRGKITEEGAEWTTESNY